MIDFFTKKLRLIGFYNKPEQTMYDEAVDAGSALLLASLLEESFLSLKQNPETDPLFKSILNGNTVFILKDEEGNLFAYYPWKGKARITDVVYDRRNVTPVPLTYKRWFYPGKAIRLIKEKPSSQEGL